MNFKREVDVAIIGGGAAGIFAAINCARLSPQLKIVVLEKSDKLLSKVKVSGGGRCNVTHACYDPKLLVKNYPRGEQFLLKAFQQFNPKHTVEWFEQRKIKLKTEGDGRMFPESNESQTVIDCFLNEANKLGVEIWLKNVVTDLICDDNNYLIKVKGQDDLKAKKVLITTGGHPKEEANSFLKRSGHSVSKPLASLFTFNIKDKSLQELMGISIKDVSVKIKNIHFLSRGPVLITHWGLSGPSVLKLSAFAAKELFLLDYKYTVLLNWLPDFNNETLRAYFHQYRQDIGKATVSSNPFQFPKRLWDFLLKKAEIEESTRWAELAGKKQNNLIQILLSDSYLADGKTTFKEEFVTCGGVSLQEIDETTMESNLFKGLYFAGEVMDIDGITGGFNFQAAWTTSWLAAKSLSVK